jgi:hypothetical protein
MLKTRITEQYGLKVPFINAGMAFDCYRAPGAGGVRPAEWECWALLQCPPTCCKQRFAILKQ